jgi:hypothetical protein
LVGFWPGPFLTGWTTLGTGFWTLEPGYWILDVGDWGYISWAVGYFEMNREFFWCNLRIL